MKTLTFWLIVVSLSFTMLASCGSDEESKGASGNSGSGGSVDDGGAGDSATGGTGGGNGGSATGGDGGEAGAPESGWKKGVVGKSKGVVTLAENAGNLQGFAVSLETTMMKTMDFQNENKPINDTPPQTAPKIDSGGIGSGKFSQMILPILPYQTSNETPIPPYTMIVDGDWNTETIQHFETWPSQDVDMSCYTPYPTTVNGQSMKAYNGFSMDTAVCLNRWFLVTNGSTIIWELFPDGTRSAVVDLKKPLSAILCHPQGYLIVSALTTYIPEAGFKVKTPSSIYKVDIDGKSQLIADMPVPSDYATNDMFGLCGAFPGIYPDYIAPGMNIFLTMHPNGSLLVGEMGAQRIYNIDVSGNITEFAKMQELTVGGLLAPNEIIYTVVPPMLNPTRTIVYKGTRIRAFANNEWQEVFEVEGYNNHLEALQHTNRGTPCEEDPSGYCYQPVGTYFKLAPGTTPMLLITDPIKGELSAIPLDMDETEPEIDAGVGGSAGSAGN